MNWSSLHPILIYNRAILTFLFLCNLLGTIFGYVWYAHRLSLSHWKYWLFIPDSPNATLCLTVSIGLMLFNHRNAIIDTLAFITLIKYGVWAIFMIIFLSIHDQTIYLLGVILLVTHAIMVIQAFLFLPRLKITCLSISFAMVWVFHNDVIDYVFHQFPKYGSLTPYESIIGYVAFWLSVLPSLISIYVCHQRKVKKFDHY